jgi:hypothetical protein
MHGGGLDMITVAPEPDVCHERRGEQRFAWCADVHAYVLRAFEGRWLKRSTSFFRRA